MATGSVSALTISTYTTISDIVTAASGFTISKATVTTWGKVAQIAINIAKSSAQSTDVSLTIATVKSPFRPLVTTNGLGNTSTIKVLTIDSGGVVNAYGQWTANTIRTVSFTYILP